MNEEKFLLDNVGTERPFRVPEGYFSDFSRQMMEQLPPKTLQSVPQKRFTGFRFLRPAIAAACLVAFISGAGILYFKGDNSADRNVAVQQPQPVVEYSIDEMVEYAMLDNEEIYNYVIDEQ